MCSRSSHLCGHSSCLRTRCSRDDSVGSQRPGLLRGTGAVANWTVEDSRTRRTAAAAAAAAAAVAVK